MATFLFYDDKIINIFTEKEKPSGGAAVQAYGWIRGLLETGQNVYVMTHVKQGDPLKEACKDVQLVPLYDPNKGLRWLRWLYYRAPYIYKKLQQLRPDFLYQGVPCWQSSLLGLICKKLHITYILRISNDCLLDERFYNKSSRIHRYFQRWGMQLADYILCQNDYQLQLVQKVFPDKKVVKIANPIFLPSVEEIVPMQDRSYIAWLGLYQYQKNLMLLYEIACLLKREQFLIAGNEASKCDAETHFYLRKLKQLPNVRFTGFLPRQQVLPFLAHAKFLLNTSHYEGFSNTFLEAMSVGTPVITSQKVNPDFIISKHNLGIVYNDLTDLRTKYASLTRDLYESMSSAVQQYVKKQHDYKIVAKKLMAILDIKVPYGEEVLEVL